MLIVERVRYTDWGRGVVLIATARPEPVAVCRGQHSLLGDSTQAEQREARLKRERELSKKREDDEKARARAIQQFHVSTGVLNK